MNRPRMHVAATLSALLLAAPAGAGAQAPTVTAPPGNSGIDQYVELVPAAQGSKLPPKAGKKGAKSGNLTPATRRGLAAQGSDGQAVAALTAATAPQPRARKRTARDRRDRGTAVVPVTVTPLGGSGDSSTGAVIHALTGSESGGMGVVLPAILGASVAGAIAFALGRRRRGPTDAV